MGADPIRDFDELAAALLAERSQLVRRALSKRLAKGDPVKVLRLLADLQDRSMPEAAYLVEGAARRVPLLELVGQLPSRLRLVAVMSTPPGVSLRPLDAWRTWRDPTGRFEPPLAVVVLGAAEIREAPEAALARAFHEGLDPGDPPALGRIPARRLRAAVADLSPFESGGLGTYDELACIVRVDELYLFFEQLLFLLERGALDQPITSTSQP